MTPRKRGARTPKAPPLENQVSAARYIGDRIKQASGTYALMGGFALLLLGSQRSTRDVDMVTDLRMKQIWSLIEGDSWLIIPKSKKVADVLKIFVNTGPGFDDCKLSKAVEVDIALPGVKGTPASIGRATATVKGLSSLDVTHILRGKLSHYASREFDRDFEDIVFLLRNYQDQIKEGRRSLRGEDVELFLNSEDLSETARATYAKILKD
ncbi:Putative Nucleotidyltransferase superfamily [Septoria linicola]|uniref:Nucleotidyltransferase superfamily n=1 Tax=Septoria linicola TaxID=215465 RepID=A0A9Q9EJR2_9PEZI|nr:putative Nucleotidyltransferase superfamily [Septoria linicola]USW52484.1 Putative Nucleotidyltransferase superfamily [Septoria linicola]